MMSLTLGEWVRGARQAIRPKLTLEALAEAAGVKTSAIHALETQSKPLAEGPLLKVAARLGLSADELLLRAGLVPGDVVAWLQAKPERLRAVRALMASEERS
jgi:transcriptional regulator with XRE-family HTH domain